MEYVKDSGTFKPNIWGRENGKKVEEKEDKNENDGGKNVQPVIYVLNIDPSLFAGLRSGAGNGREITGSIWNGILSSFYWIRKLIKIVFIAGIILLVLILITRPEILTKLFIGIFKKIGLYNFIMEIKRVLK